MDDRFDQLNGRFDAPQRTMIVGLFDLSGSIIAVCLAVLIKLG